jgi:hypothetical protein
MPTANSERRKEKNVVVERQGKMQGGREGGREEGEGRDRERQRQRLDDIVGAMDTAILGLFRCEPESSPSRIPLFAR